MAKRIKGITIEIGGDTTKLDEALSKSNKRTRELTSELRGVNNALKFNPNNVDLLSQKQRALGDQIGNTKTKLEALKQAQEKASQAFAEGKIGEAQYQAITKEVIVAESQLKNFEKQQRTVNKTLSELSTPVGQLGQRMQDTGKKATELSGKFAPISVAAGGAMAISIKSAIDFESAMACVAKTVDMSDQEFQDMSKSIREMARELPASTTEIASVAEAAGQLGISKEHILDFSRTIIDLGESTNLASEEGAVALAQFANITQMSEKEFSNLGSVIVDLGNNMATTEADIVRMGQRLAGTGTQIGLTEAEIMALAAAAGSVGIEAEAGGTALSTTMTKINSAVMAGGEEMMAFANVAGISAGQFASDWKDKPAEAFTTFIQGLNQVSENGGNVDQVLKDLGITGIRETDTLKRLAGAGELLGQSFLIAGEAWKENTALSEEAQQRYDTLASKFEMLKNSFQEVAIVLGEALIPVVEKVTEGLTAFANFLSDLPPGLQTVIASILALVAVIAPALGIFGTLMQTVGGGLKFLSGLFVSVSGLIGPLIGLFKSLAVGIAGLGKAFVTATGPIGLIITIIGLLIGWLVHLYNTNEDFRNKVNEIWNSIKDFVVNAVEAIKTAVTGAWENIKTAVIDTMSGVKEGVTSGWNAVKENTGNLLEGIKSTVSTKWIAIKEGISNTISAIASVVTSGWERIKNVTSEKWNAVKEMITKPIDLAKDHIKSALDNIKDFFSGLKLEFPKIKLPHFKVSGNFSIKPPSVPKFDIDWYKRGGIFTSPTIFSTPSGFKGVGEAGAEAVLPLSRLDNMLDNAVRKNSSDKELVTLLIALIDEVRALKDDMKNMPYVQRQLARQS